MGTHRGKYGVHKMATPLGMILRVKIELKMGQMWHLIGQSMGTCFFYCTLRAYGYYWMHTWLLYSFEILMYWLWWLIILIEAFDVMILSVFHRYIRLRHWYAGCIDQLSRIVWHSDPDLCLDYSDHLTCIDFLLYIIWLDVLIHLPIYYLGHLWV